MSSVGEKNPARGRLWNVEFVGLLAAELVDWRLHTLYSEVSAQFLYGLPVVFAVHKPALPTVWAHQGHHSGRYRCAAVVALRLFGCHRSTRKCRRCGTPPSTVDP